MIALVLRGWLALLGVGTVTRNSRGELVRACGAVVDFRLFGDNDN